MQSEEMSDGRLEIGATQISAVRSLGLLCLRYFYSQNNQTPETKKYIISLKIVYIVILLLGWHYEESSSER